MSDHRLDGAHRLGDAILQWLDANAAQGICITNAELHIRSWNEWLAAATGISAAAAIGRHLFEVVPSMVERGFDQYYADALRGEVKVLSHAFHKYIVPTPVGPLRDEQMPQSGRIAPLAQGRAVIGTITLIDDVGERVASDRELRNQIATAEAASRVKDEFLATLSHEIRTPLNAVLGWTRILLGRENLEAAMVRRAIEVIDRNATAQLTLVSDMLDMARVSAGKVRLDMADVDLAVVVMAAIDVIRPGADAKDVEIVTTIPPNLPTVRGDGDRLLQVVWNLLSNALKFTEPGGQVTLGLSADRRGVRLTVTDTGQGIAPAFLPHVFERFKQADPSSSRRHGGLGLGLALVRELMELHGGSVSVESPGIGLGTTFVARFPTREAASPKEPRPSDAKSVQDGALSLVAPGILTGIHLLVVEDDIDALEILVRTVTDAGASVSATRSAAEALTLLRARGGRRPHAVVSDIGMPREDGYSLLREVRRLPVEEGGKLPVIAVTAYATPQDRARALAAGFAFHFGKPFVPQGLIAAIASVVNLSAPR